MIKPIATIAAMLVSFATVTSAEPVINAKALPKGVTKAEVLRVFQSAQRSTDATIARRSAAVKMVSDRSAAILASQRTRAAELSISDAEFKSFLLTQKTIGLSKDVNKVVKLKSLYMRRRAVLDRVYKASGGGRAGEASGLQKLLAPYAERAQRVATSILAFFVGRAAEPAPATIASEVRFTAPYAVHDSKVSKSGLAVMDGTASITNTDARMDLHAFAIEGLGNCTAQGFAGIVVDVPPDKSRMNIKVLYNLSYKVVAAASVFSLGVGRVVLHIDIQPITAGVNVPTLDGDPEEIAGVWAYFGLDEDQSDQASYYVNGAPVVGGKQYMITVSPFAEAISANASWGEANLTVTPTAVEVTFE